MHYRKKLTRKLAILATLVLIASLAITLVAVPAGAINQATAPPGFGEVLNSPVTIPTMINYQGYLTDPDGHPITGTLEMTFSIYGDAVGGMALWTETQSSVTVTDGLFNVLLGSVNPVDASYFTGESYLGVQVGADPEMTPRQPMVSVAYALVSDKANDADTLDGMDSTEFGDGHSLDAADGDPEDAVYVDDDGKVGIGMTNPGEKLSVAGIIESIEGGVKFPDGTVQTTAYTDSWQSSELGTISFTIEGLSQDPVALYYLNQHMTSGFDPVSGTMVDTESFDEFSIVIREGPLMPILYQALVLNQPVEVVIELWRPGEMEEEHYMTITAQNILIAHMETVVESGELDPTMQEIAFIVSNTGSTVTWIWEDGGYEATWGSGTPLEESVEYWAAGEGPGIPPLEGEPVFARFFSHQVSVPFNPASGQPTGRAFYEGFMVSKNVDAGTIVNSIPCVGTASTIYDFLLTTWEYNSMGSGWEKKEYYVLDGDVCTFELEITSDGGVLTENVCYYGPFVIWGYYEGSIEYGYDFRGPS